MLKALSNSKDNQDYFVLNAFGFKEKGYFVEFGAADGYYWSNTSLLETHYGWTGILAEPIPHWIEMLKANRPNCHLEPRCVWTKTGEILEFSEMSLPLLSTIKQITPSDMFSGNRQEIKTYPVETISLNDLLAKYQAPNQIDYLSIDTEGSEYLILNSLDFDKYSFGVITCEHNYTENRQKIFRLII